MVVLSNLNANPQLQGPLSISIFCEHNQGSGENVDAGDTLMDELMHLHALGQADDRHTDRQTSYTIITILSTCTKKYRNMQGLH